MRLSELQDNQEVRVRVGEEENSPTPTFGPWKDDVLHLERDSLGRIEHICVRKGGLAFQQSDFQLHNNRFLDEGGLVMEIDGLSGL